MKSNSAVWCPLLICAKAECKICVGQMKRADLTDTAAGKPKVLLSGQKVSGTKASAF